MKWSNLISLVIVSVLFVELSEGNQPGQSLLSACHKAAEYSNGCGNFGSGVDSDAGRASAFLNNLLKESCNKHDICYWCGNSWKVSKERCDTKFLNDMKKQCYASIHGTSIP